MNITKLTLLINHLCTCYLSSIIVKTAECVGLSSNNNLIGREVAEIRFQFNGRFVGLVHL